MKLTFNLRDGQEQLGLLDRVADEFYGDAMTEEDVVAAEGASNFYSELMEALRQTGRVTIEVTEGGGPLVE